MGQKFLSRSLSADLIMGITRAICKSHEKNTIKNRQVYQMSQGRECLIGTV